MYFLLLPFLLGRNRFSVTETNPEYNLASNLKNKVIFLGSITDKLTLKNLKKRFVCVSVIIFFVFAGGEVGCSRPKGISQQWPGTGV